MKNQMTKVMMTVALTAILTACGGSGGSSSPSTGDGGYTPPGNGGGGSTGGGNGNASYYAIQTYPANAPIEDTALPGSAMFVANEFYVDVLDAGQAMVEVGIYSPTCLNGAAYKDYSVVLLDGGSETHLSVRVTSSGLSIQKDAIDFNIPDKKKVGSLTTWSGTCSNGKMTLSGGGYAFSNGKSIVIRTPTNNYTYAGFSNDVVLNAVSNTISQVSFENSGVEQPFDYLFNDYTDMVNGVANTSANTMGDSVRVYGGTVKISSNLTTTLIPNGSVDVNSGISIFSASGRYYEAVVANFSGHKAVFAADSGGGVSCTNQSGNYSTCSGISRLFLAIQQ